MSLGVVIKGTEGLVLAAESRVTLTVTAQNPGPPPLHVNFDNATKLLSFSPPHHHVGVVTYGTASIGLRTAQSFIPEFESSLPTDRIPVPDFAKLLGEFFMEQWKQAMSGKYNGSPMTLVAGGFDEGDPYGRVFIMDIPYRPQPTERNPHPDFGITWGGQREFVDRILQGFDSRLQPLTEQVLGKDDPKLKELITRLQELQMQIPLQAMALQDCVDLAIFMIRTTINAQSLTVGIRGVGGAIDVATVTRNDGLRFVQRKSIRGEQG
ncbi:MAG: hypothetical protein HYX78_07985 [Armatimonadetes bacterium]|nr:hypothetical protein [Armatimonadota bacterium]